jgi:hypothetical protein
MLTDTHANWKITHEKFNLLVLKTEDLALTPATAVDMPDFVSCSYIARYTPILRCVT